MESRKKVVIHSDGGCEGNPGPGGWAAVLRHGNNVREISGGEAATTNNRMELQAAIEGLAALREPCEVEFFTDSEYVREGITSWVPLWKSRNWMTTLKKAVKNEDLWRRLDELAGQHRITWHWLRGHAGHADNERCDVLAAQEIAKIRAKLSPAELAMRLEEFERTRSKFKDQQELL
jgi:ribonuclease HI